jgi:hypothetical protein
LPSTGASARSFGIFQFGRDHQAVTAKTVHLVILSESECGMEYSYLRPA